MYPAPRPLLLLRLALLCPLAAFGESASADRVPVIGGPCQGCELVFEGMPEHLSESARVAPPGEPGEPLTVEGVVRNGNGSPAAGIIVYAYHTNAVGIYPKDVTWHGRLRGWARTDSAGRYRFTTIRPAGYPDGAENAHIHMHVIEPGRGTYYIDNVVFDDDPDLPDRVRQNARNGRGGSGLTYPKREGGTWKVQRDIVLGKNIPRYDESAQVGPGA